MIVDRAFDAQADPIRREILAVLAARAECSAGELSDAVQRTAWLTEAYRVGAQAHLRWAGGANGTVSPRCYRSPCKIAARRLPR